VEGLYDGQWRHGTGQVVESHNPATGELLARVRGATAEEVGQTLEKAREAYVQWRTVPAPQRGVILQDIGRALEEHKDDIGAIVSAEMGKIATEGKGEVQEIIDIVGYAVGLSRSIGGVVLPSERAQHFITEVSNPLGVCGVVSAAVKMCYAPSGLS
jgi:aldehyde dehydrogenase family 7 protein A1